MTGKRFVIFLSLLVLSDASLLSDIDVWENYKAKHSKHYNSIADDIHHFRIFIEHKRKIDEHNMHYENGIEHYRLGLNEYSDLPPEDFMNMMNGVKADKNMIDRDKQSIPFDGPGDINLPKSIDWRMKGAVTEVKNQLYCGSCYAFAATGALESQYFLKTGRMTSLSEQNIVDCSISYGNHGCHGGFPQSVFEYVRDHGIGTEQSYPYHAHESGYCQANVQLSNVTVHGFSSIPSGNEDELVKALVVHGPIPVLFDASHPSLQHYSSGIWHEPNCGSDFFHLSHAVLLVGYGTNEFNVDYYILKNSWGPTWGESGYFRMSRNQNNHCGIATGAVFPIM